MVCALVASGALARAETDDAETLFRDGKRLLEDGQIEEACKKLEASERIEARDVTELNLADCWEQQGKTASAWEMFVKLAGSAKREDRAAEARKRAKKLEAKLVHLTIEVPAEAELDELVITRDEQIVDRAAWNQRLPVDPAEYTITARAPGREEWSRTITVKSRDRTVEVPRLARARRTPDREPAVPNRNRGLAIGLVAAGAGAIVVASGVALHSRSLQRQSDELCPNQIYPTCGDLRGVELNRRARQEGWFANITWGLGGAAVVGGVVAWVVGRDHPDRRVSITPVVTSDRAGLALGGRF